MNELKAWHNRTIGEKVVAALEKNRFKAEYAESRKEALEKILSLIPADAKVGVAGSWTIQELTLDSLLEERGNTVYNHNKPGLSREESVALRHQEMTADVLITGSNAITLDGQLINVDGFGNRVAAMIFGPKKAIVIAGINKIAADLNAGVERVKLIAAPMNNKRLNINNPCATTGVCMDCQSPTRICNVTTIMHKKPSGIDIHVIIIGEDLGF